MQHHCRPIELKFPALLFWLALFLTGCSSSYTVSSIGKPNSEYSYQEMNEELRGRNVTIELNDGREISGEDVTISHDSVSWLDANTTEQSRVSTRQIRRIVSNNHIVGGLEGLGIVTPLVFVTSWSLGGFSREGIGGSDGWAFPAALGLIGGGIAAITGGIIGHSYNYEFPVTEHSDSLQNGK